MGGARMVDEMEGPVLGEGMPEDKLQEPYYDGKMNGMVEDLECL